MTAQALPTPALAQQVTAQVLPARRALAQRVTAQALTTPALAQQVTARVLTQALRRCAQQVPA